MLVADCTKRGEYIQTCAASTTLLCLNGLKSSLICTGELFLIVLVPKNGLGVGGVCTQIQTVNSLLFQDRNKKGVFVPIHFSASETLTPTYSTHQGTPRSKKKFPKENKLEPRSLLPKAPLTGVKLLAFGLGLNDIALTFKRLLAAVLGDMGPWDDAGVDPEPDPPGVPARLTPFVWRPEDVATLVFAFVLVC